MTKPELPGNDEPPKKNGSLDRRDWLLRALFLVPIGGIAVLGMVATLAIQKTDRTLRPILSEASKGQWAPAKDEDVAAIRIASAAAAAREAETFLPYTDRAVRTDNEPTRLPVAIRELSEIRRMILPEDVAVRPGAIATALRELQTDINQSYPEDGTARVQLALQKRELEAARQEIIRLEQQVGNACPKAGADKRVPGSSEGDYHPTSACGALGIPIEESPFRIYFNSGRAELTPTERRVVAFIVKSWHEHGEPAVIIAGYTDPAGMDKVNRLLRWRRASLVAAALKSESSGKLRSTIVQEDASIPGVMQIRDKDERARVALIWFKT